MQAVANLQAANPTVVKGTAVFSLDRFDAADYANWY
jgi:hypothetical protein